MPFRNQWIIMMLIIAGLQLPACQQEPETSGRIPPPGIGQLGDTIIYRLRLTAKTAEKYNIKTTPVREIRVARSSIESLQKVIPNTAVFYDPNGGAWIYTSPEPLVFIRRRISVDYVEGDQAILTDGPPFGTEVVTDGVDKLFLSEIEGGF